MKVKLVSEWSFRHVYSFISYVGREYQDMKLQEKNEGNVRLDTEHLEVNIKIKAIHVFIDFYYQDDG